MQLGRVNIEFIWPNYEGFKRDLMRSAGGLAILGVDMAAMIGTPHPDLKQSLAVAGGWVASAMVTLPPALRMYNHNEQPSMEDSHEDSDLD